MTQITGLYNSVKEYHNLIGNYIPDKPSFLTREQYDLNIFLIQEDLEEYEIAYKRKDLPACANALGNLIYAITGLSLKMGIQIDDILNGIHHNNIERVGTERNINFCNCL